MQWIEGDHNEGPFKFGNDGNNVVARFMFFTSLAGIKPKPGSCLPLDNTCKQSRHASNGSQWKLFAANGSDDEPDAADG